MIKKIRKLIRRSLDASKLNADGEQKPPLHLMYDLCRWILVNRGYVHQFFIIGLNKKERKLSDYLNYRSFKHFYRTFYPPSYLCLLEDKLVFEKFINNFPRYAPKNIGSVSKYHFYLQDGLPQPLENILDYPMNCIVKNTLGFGGRNIFLLKIEGGKLFINGVQSTMEEFVKRLPEKAVLQEILEQHQVLRELHPFSINTARIVTVNTGIEVKVISTFLRVGVNGNYVDNIAQGNIFVPIDRSTGKLARDGHTNNNIRILKHPQTQVTFEGIEIPFYDEATELCRKLHFQLPYFFILGWDIAFTPDGPVVIESNNIHKLVDEQKFEGGLRKQFDIYIKEFIENKHKERKFDYA